MGQLLVFSKESGFLTSDGEWTTCPDEATKVSMDDARSLISTIRAKGFSLARRDTSEKILSEDFPTWMLEKAFSLEDKELQRFCDWELGVVCEKRTHDWLLFQSGGQKVVADEHKLKNVLDEAIRMSPSDKLISLANTYFGKDIHQVGVDLISLQSR
ncbi:hypothetical protein VCHA53O466_50498 [Vibrio chagasii]|nr:hypothetical protein VCHA53O466_50498 [Vibrio chagasii]